MKGKQKQLLSPEKHNRSDFNTRKAGFKLMRITLVFLWVNILSQGRTLLYKEC